MQVECSIMDPIDREVGQASVIKVRLIGILEEEIPAGDV